MERETLARTRKHSCPRWRIAGRDRHGRLVLATLVRAGARWPGKRRLTLLTIAAEGLYYQHRLVNATNPGVRRSASTVTCERPPEPTKPSANH